MKNIISEIQRQEVILALNKIRNESYDNRYNIDSALERLTQSFPQVSFNSPEYLIYKKVDDSFLEFKTFVNRSSNKKKDFELIRDRIIDRLDKIIS